ncbi:MAG: hypothetical protein ACRD8Z_08325 [Nitrososphaeraceae archaeon]
MSDNYDKRKLFLMAISAAAILIGTFVVDSQFIRQSLAQDLGQDVGLN